MTDKERARAEAHKGDIWYEPPTDHYEDDVRYGTPGEMISEIKRFRSERTTALADVERLTAERDRLADQLRWRDPVREPPPVDAERGESARVLVLTRHSWGAEHDVAAINAINEWCNGNWHRDMPNDGSCVVGWMPLPAGPVAGSGCAAGMLGAGLGWAIPSVLAQVGFDATQDVHREVLIDQVFNELRSIRL